MRMFSKKGGRTIGKRPVRRSFPAEKDLVLVGLATYEFDAAGGDIFHQGRRIKNEPK